MRSRLMLVVAIVFCLIGTAQAAPVLDLTLQGPTEVDFNTPFQVEIWAQATPPIATAYFDMDYSSGIIDATSVDLESVLNFFPETGAFSPGHIALVGGGNVSGFGGGAAVKIGTINFTSLNTAGTADISLAFTTADECALVGGGALPEGDIGFGSHQVYVPEPGSVLLVSAGLASLLARRRRGA